MNIQKYVNKLEMDKITIFLFHGVIKNNPYKVRNYNRKHILESEFYDLLKNLKMKGTPISIEDFIIYHKYKINIPKYSFIISFDDGFENNYSIAAPILNDLKIPCVYYITSSFVDRNMMSWIDQIDYAIEETSVEKLSLSFLERPFNIATVDKKRSFLEYIRNLAKGNRDFFLNKETHISEIFSVCNVPRAISCDSPIDLKMKWNQVSDLNRNNLFTIGGHTHTHPIMSYLEKSDLEYEINTCIDFLKKSGLKRINHFSYPEGLEHCYNESVINALKYRGIRCCPSAIDGVNIINEDLFHLKRVAVI